MFKGKSTNGINLLIYGITNFMCGQIYGLYTSINVIVDLLFIYYLR